MNDPELLSDSDPGTAVDTVIDVAAVDCLRYAVCEDDQLQPGESLGGLTIVRYVNAGGMGEVYEAEQGGGLFRRVILKVGRGLRSEADRARFVREGEIQAEAGLHHQNILPVHAAGQEGDRVFLVLPFVRGASIREIVRAVRGAVSEGLEPDVPALVIALADNKDRDCARPWLMYSQPATPTRMSDDPPAGNVALPRRYYRWVAERMIEATRAIDAAHRTGVLHRDVSPSNLLVEAETNQLKVCDFGLGVRFESLGDRGGEAPVKCGTESTPGYTAPEVSATGKADRRSDIYSLGACLFELLTLRKPGSVGSSTAPADLLAVAGKALTADADGRYSTAAAFADDLQRWLDRRPTMARWNWLHYPRALALWVRRNTAWAITGLVVATTITLAVEDSFATERRKAAREKYEVERRLDLLKALTAAQDSLRVQPPLTGWPERIKGEFRKVINHFPEADLRDYVAETLSGLDLTHIYDHNLPRPHERNGHGGLAEIAFSPNGKRILAAAYWDGPGKPLSPALLWDGNLANKMTPGARLGRGPVTFPDDQSPLQLLLTDQPQRSLPLWNVETGETVLEIPLSTVGFVTTAALSADARFAVVSYVPSQNAGKQTDPVTVLWTIDRKAPTAVRKVGEWPGEATAFAFSSDSSLLAIGSAVGDTIVRSTTDSSLSIKLQESGQPISALAFGRDFRRFGDEKPALVQSDRKLLAIGSNGGDLSVWDLQTRTRISTMPGSEFSVHCLAFSPDGATLVSAGQKSPFLWDVATGRPLQKVQARHDGFPTWTSGVAFSPDGSHIAFGSAVIHTDGGLDVFRLDDNRGIRTYRGLAGVVEKVWLSPSGKYVAALTQNWRLGVFERETGRVVFVWEVLDGWYADNSAAAFSSDEKEIIVSSGRRASRWSLATGERTGLWKLELGLNDALAVRPGKNPILVRRDRIKPTAPMAIHGRELGPDNKLIDLYEIADGNNGGLRMSYSHLSTDGRHLLICGRASGTPFLYDGLTGKAILLDTNAFPPESRAFSLNDNGTILGVNEGEKETIRAHYYKLPDMIRLGVQPRMLLRPDDSGRLGVVDRSCFDQLADGVSLFRIGEANPLVTFDLSRPPSGNEHNFGISPDGKFVYWGRRDGTVCIADVNKCLEQLTPFGKR